MKTHLLIALLAAGAAGCAGLDITPISPEAADAAHKDGSSLKGYIIYEPMVVVEVSRREVCGDKDDKGNCRSTVVTCSAGAPFVLPDTSKPFLIDVRSGFGKTAVDVSITNGWQLGSFKDNSDNTALLDTVNKVIGLAGARALGSGAKAETCKAPGLYRVITGKEGATLRRLVEY